ncbi:MAG TPA: methyltransferase domain-containing protein [Steroidobacteraceae bacterium]|nr:methyltransferase domain-containing protein [Steroidobacteraceae bacterium]
MRATPDNAAANWFEGPLGGHVLSEESALAQRVLDDVFGFELLQVGGWGPARHLLDGARTQHTTLLAPEPGAGVSLCAPLTALPFASDSIDAILLPHTLELVEDPYAMLREAERVLCAEGCLMICGFNPWSGWGVRRLFAHYLRRPPFPPQTRRLLAERRLRDWVALLDFEVENVYGYLGTLPLAARQRPPGASGEPLPRRRLALTCGGYLLKARKRVQTLTLIRPKRRTRQRVLVPATESTSKVGSRKVGSHKVES